MPDAFLASLSQTPEEVAWFFPSQTAQSFWRSNGSVGRSVELRVDFTSFGICVLLRRAGPPPDYRKSGVAQPASYFSQSRLLAVEQDSYAVDFGRDPDDCPGGRHHQ